MSQASQLSRVRPAVLVIAGAAAAYGVYLVFTTLSPGQPDSPDKSSLRRSNARRGPRHLFRVSPEPPDDSAPLGWVVASLADRRFATNVNADGVPTPSQVASHFPDVDTIRYTKHELDVAAVKSVIQACWLARGDAQKQAKLRECGVDGISQALEAEDVPRVFALATPLLDQVLGADHETIQHGTWKFLRDLDLVSDPPLEGDLPTADVDVTETEDISNAAGAPSEPDQGLKGLLYHIAETNAKRKAYEHRGINCEECGERPIRGVRWHCLNCPDFDLCSTCEATTTHHKTHVFVKIKIPLPVLSQPTQVHPLWYPGEAYKIFKGLPVEERARLKKAYDLDDAHMDACYDQFTSFANVRWKADPTHIHAAIDRRAFNKALTCERWPKRFRPNALYDRMFAFYDTNGDALIGFEEFLSGLAYLRGSNRFTPLQRALEGFDIDADGYVDRQDFLRLLQAKFEIQKLLVNDMIEGQEREQSHAALDILRSSQPISSIFRWEEIPQGEQRVPVGKTSDVFGDMSPLPGNDAVLENDEGWDTEQSGRQRRLPGESHEQLRHHLSRFEEMLSDNAEGPSCQRENLLPNGHAQKGAGEEDGDNEEHLNQDYIWQITLEGFNELLDRLFKIQEDEDQKVIDARPEMVRWKQEIDEAVRQKEELKVALQREIASSGTSDPLMETAMNSLSSTLRVEEKSAAGGDTPAAFKSDIVPTDHDTLTKREEEIAQKPLEELLKDIGYSAVGEDTVDAPAGTVNGHDGTLDSAVERNIPKKDTRFDPTMPQNRPDTASPATSALQENGDAIASQHAAAPPSRVRLEELGELAAIDREILARGGPGRLSFAEVEAMVKSDKTRELKGLVTEWLEWASF